VANFGLPSTCTLMGSLAWGLMLEAQLRAAPDEIESEVGDSASAARYFTPKADGELKCTPEASFADLAG